MAAPFSPKSYQTATLEALRRFLEKAVAVDDPDTAFIKLTKRPYVQAPGLPGLPYVCLRVPTGGGKTVLAAHSVGVAADAFIRTGSPLVLWFTPSQIIRDQTLSSLQDRDHPNRRALADRFGENVRVMSLSDALYAGRADYDGGAVVIVATIQAFRVEDTEGRKVYEANGGLMDHFSGLPEALRSALEIGSGGNPIPSLANVLRMRRPMVIMDEAHNARSPLSFDTLARLKPSLIVEFTATPVTPDEHNPAKGVYASNVLHHVSAAELKAAEMIKLPVVLRGRSEPKDTIADAIAWLDGLNDTAKLELAATGEFIRPVMLIQAEPRSKDKPTLHAEEVKKLLVDDFLVPETHIALATGDSRELDGVDLFNPACTIRFIITQQALREGWDCSFAYVLCSVAEQKSARSVEQLLGRVLRMPRATRKLNEDLNRAYAFATTTSFQNAATTLRDGLVNNGFERIEAASLIRAEAPVLDGFEEGGSAFTFEEELPDGIDLAALAPNIALVTGGRANIDVAARRIVARGSLSDYDRTALKLAIPDASKAIDAIVARSRGAQLRPLTPDAQSVVFAVPRLGVRRGDTLKLFDRTDFLDTPWKLEEHDAAAVLDHFAAPRGAVDEAHVDVSEGGEVKIEFVDELHRQLGLALEERGWTKAALINWLDRRLPSSSRRDITRTSTTLFIASALNAIDGKYGLGLDGLARAKYRLLDAIQKSVADHRDVRQASAFQAALFPQSGLDFETSADLALVFDEERYAYNQPYKGAVAFRRHLFRVVGDLETSGEEHDCAVYIDRHPRVKSWVRNTSNQPTSFWLQTATDKFYPDFLALLHDGRVAAIEYKGSHLASGDDAKEKLLVGELWAERSEGGCLFSMVEDRQFSRLSLQLERARG